MAETNIQVKSIFWSPTLSRGHDLHVLEGKSSRSLAEILYIEYSYKEEGSSEVKTKNVAATNRPQSITIEFTPKFVVGSTLNSQSGTLQKSVGTYGDDVTVNKNTGRVQVNRIGQLRNFLILVKVVDPATQESFSARIRAHMHKSVTNAWLTPNPLTIRQSPEDGSGKARTDGQRFTVLAEFNDKSIGNVTFKSGDDDFTWSSADTQKVQITDPKTGAMFAHATGQSVTITARLPTSLGGKQCTAKVKTEKPWATPVYVEPVACGQPNLEDIANRPNILFLSDGFLQSDEPFFNELVVKIANYLQSQDSTIPFKYFKINYWKAFIPSSERGMAISYDLTPRRLGLVYYAYSTTQGDRYRRLPPNEMEHYKLVEEVGIPVATDDPPPDFNTKLLQWQTLFNPQLSAPAVTDSLYERWKMLADHRLTHEPDTAFSLAAGTAASASYTDRFIQWNPLRTTRAHVDQLLLNLKYKYGNEELKIGDTWGGKQGKDRKLVVIISSGAYSIGTNSPETPYDPKYPQNFRPNALAASTFAYGYTILVQDSTDSRVLKLVSDYLCPTIPATETDPSKKPTIPESIVSVSHTIAHELAHSLAIGDEYGRKNITFPKSREKELDRWGNVQGRESLLVREGAKANVGLNGEAIKWLWPRISKAGVLLEDPKDLGDGKTFKLVLDKEQIRQFQVNEWVRLRKRPLVSGAKPSIWLGITEKSDEYLKVSVLTPQPDYKPYSGCSTDGILSFVKGSIVFMTYIPTATPSPVGYVEYTLISPDIINHITGSGGPLNAPANDPMRSCSESTIDPNNYEQRPTNLPANFDGSKYRNLGKAIIIGAYECGDSYFCGVYHPSGRCLMRNSAGLQTNHFCHVCRYILVDQIDPSKHGEIDLLYAPYYP